LQTQQEQGQHTHEGEEPARSQSETTSRQRNTRSQRTWPTYIMSVGELNDEGVPLDMITIQGFDELTKNEKDKLFENSIQAYVPYLEELKKKGKKVVMKIISHAWKSYKSKLVKIWRDQDTPCIKYKDVTKEDWARFIERCESEHFALESQYMQWL
jgi:hypothetical protein